jgi:hypothetical protein
MGDEMGQLNDLVRGVFYGTSMWRKVESDHKIRLKAIHKWFILCSHWSAVFDIAPLLFSVCYTRYQLYRD